MISISEQAKEVLWRTLSASGLTPNKALRLVPGEDGFSLEVDQPTEDDRVIRYKEEPVLVIDGDFDDVVDDLLIDVVAGSQGNSLTIRRHD